MCETCSELIIKIPERRHWRRAVVSLLLSRFHILLWFSIVDFKQVNVGMVIPKIPQKCCENFLENFVAILQGRILFVLLVLDMK